jgi:hypothetical protein
MSPEDKAHIAALNRAVQVLAAKVEGLLAQATRLELLELARIVVSPVESQLSKQLAGTSLALKVLESIPAPRPVAVPSPVVSVEKENEAC